MTVYDILISTIPHRHAELCGLLAELDRQMVPGVGVRVFRDDLENDLPVKFQALLDSSGADYVSWLDDDDAVAGDYLLRVTRALEEKPDYVGFVVWWSLDGVLQKAAHHSLVWNRWDDNGDKLVRDITALNPIRRDLAMLGSWRGTGHGADSDWATQIRATRKVRREVFIPDPMYFYRHKTQDSFLTPRAPMGTMPKLPYYPWLTVL